jgi:hypothetical protein
MKRLLHPLIIGFVLYILLMIFLHYLPASEKKAWFDPVTLGTISTVYMICVISMLSRTKWLAWSILGAGFLATMAGDSILYGNAFWVRIVDPHGAMEFMVDSARAFFIIGSAYILSGFIHEEWRDRTGDAVSRMRQRQGITNQEPGA